MPGSGGVAHRTPFDLPTTRSLLQAAAAPALAAALLVAWLLVYPHTPDLAAQTYRVSLFSQLGMAVWDEHWYAGHDLPGYSLLFPPLGSLLGLKLTAFLSALSSTVLFGRLAVVIFGPGARLSAIAFALAAAGDVWMGRLAFALGVTFALAAALAFVRERPILAGLLAATCAAASPVAGILLALAAATYALLTRRARAALVLGVPPVALAAALAALFPEGGSEPYPFTSLLATLAVVGAFLLALPRSQRTLRRGAAVYTLACVACVAIATPMGSNIERYGVLLAGPLLVCAWLAERRSPMRTAVLASALCGWGVWVAWGPVRETRAVSHNESTRSSYYAPVERFLATQPGPVRVEVPLTRSHWEAALLAPRVSLARGWEKQLDESYDRVVLASHPSAAGYARWLRESAVSFVALPDTPLDGSSVGEGRLIRAGLPYLREVSSSAHWRIYAVLGSEPLLGGPGRLTSLGHDAFAVQAYAPGRLLVRVRFGRYLAIANGSGCVRRAPGGWTYVTVRMPETLAVQARFTLARALGLEGTCTGA